MTLSIVEGEWVKERKGLEEVERGLVKRIQGLGGSVELYQAPGEVEAVMVIWVKGGRTVLSVRQYVEMVKRVREGRE